MTHPRSVRNFVSAFACLLLTAGSLRSANANYDQAMEAFDKKDFGKARTAFLAVVDTDHKISPDLLYNLGNTYFRLDDPGNAALWYRRALLLDPTDKAAKQNLRLIRKRAGFLEFEQPTLAWYAGLLKNIYWKSALVAALWGAAVCLAILVFLAPQRRVRSWCWSGFGTGLALAAFAIFGVCGRASDARLKSRAVVTTPGAAALTAPTDTAGVVIDLPPGSELSVREERDGWAFAELPGDRMGWVKTDHLSRLWPFNAELVE